MIRLYRYGYVGSMRVEEIEAEGETKDFWIIKGRREAKLHNYPDTIWYRTPEEAIRAFINRKARKRDDYLRWAKECQDAIDKATAFLIKEKNP